MAKPSFGGTDAKTEDNSENRENGRLNERSNDAERVQNFNQSNISGPLPTSNLPASLNRIMSISKKNITEHLRARGINVPLEFENTDLGIKQFVFDILKTIGLYLIRVEELSINIHHMGGNFAIRVTGTAQPIALFKANINFEVIKNGVFAVGITADQADLESLAHKIFKRKINLFGKLRGPAVSKIASIIALFKYA